MKSRLAPSIRHSFLYMNLGGRILVSTLLAVIVTAAAWAQKAPSRSPAEARKEIQTRVAMEKKTNDRMLSPGFYVHTPHRKTTRQAVFHAIFSPPDALTTFLRT